MPIESINIAEVKLILWVFCTFQREYSLCFIQGLLIKVTQSYTDHFNKQSGSPLTRVPLSLTLCSATQATLCTQQPGGFTHSWLPQGCSTPNAPPASRSSHSLLTGPLPWDGGEAFQIYVKNLTLTC